MTDMSESTCMVCGKPLGQSPSDEYCNETCQRKFLATLADPLPGALPPVSAPTPTMSYTGWWYDPRRFGAPGQRGEDAA